MIVGSPKQSCDFELERLLPSAMSSELSLSRNAPALSQDEEPQASDAQDETTRAPSALTSKELLSATLTIAAAACGLISDGCEYPLIIAL